MTEILSTLQARLESLMDTLRSAWQWIGTKIKPETEPPPEKGKNNNRSALATSSTDRYEDPYEAINAENVYILTVQIAVIILISGAGSIGAGAMLNTVKLWEAFVIIKDLYLLMPVLQGLKSNVDTCFAVRLSTQANLGNLNTKAQIIPQIQCNMALVQVQAIVGSVVISLYSCALGAAVNRDWNSKHALLLATCATITACMSCLVLDLLLIGVILGSYHLNINPDNIVGPLASAAGDLGTMVLFSYLIDATYFLHHTSWWVFVVILSIYFFIILPIAIYYCFRNEETKKLLLTGWFAVILALVFSSMSSLVLDLVISHYEGYTLFQPVLNGTTGNVVSILLTRLSTMLFTTSEIGTLHEKVKICVAPYKVWFYGTPQAKCVRLLIVLGIPGQLIFVFIADYVYTHCHTMHWVFVTNYIIVSACLMFLMLYIAHLLTHLMYKVKINPGNAAIPFVNAIGDFIGSSLLAADFAFLMTIHEEYLHDQFGRN